MVRAMAKANNEAFSNERQSFIERELRFLEKAWQDGRRDALNRAVVFCHQHNLSLPQWAVYAILDLLSGGGAIGIGRLSNPHERDRQNSIHYTRWDAVNELRERRRELAKRGYHPSWEEAYANAAEMLKDSEAAGSPEAIKRSYQLVQKIFRSGKGGRFYT